MGFNYDNLPEYVRKIDECRRQIVQRCHDLGYVIPTDEIRIAAGEEPIHFSDIENWLYKRQGQVLLFQTVETDTCYLDISLKQTIPDLEIQWEYDASRPFDDIVYVKDIHDTVIKHQYSETKTHTVALYSPSKIDRICDYAFSQNTSVKSVSLPPAVTELGWSCFCKASNLETVDFSRCGNFSVIKGQAFTNTAIKDFTLPDSVTAVYGPSTFDSRFDHFKIGPESELRELHSTWLFIFNIVPSQDEYIDIPAGCRFFIDNDSTNEITNESDEKIKQASHSWNPFSRSCNRFRLGQTEYMMSDDNGIVYLKDKNGDPTCIMYVPCYNIFDTYVIPQTVRRIAYGSFMSVNAASQQITIGIPSTVEYVSPKFIYSTGKKLYFTAAGNTRYKTTQNGGLMTYSTDDFSGDPDVLIYEPPLTADVYEFPDNFSKFRDFENQVIDISNIINSRSNIKTVKINRNFPEITDFSNIGPFAINPKDGFQCAQGCNNYAVYNGCLYMRKNDNLYYHLMSVPKNAESFVVHSDCRYIANGAFANCRNLTGDLILDDIIAVSYASFIYTSGLDSIQLGDSCSKINQYSMFFSCGFKNLTIGKTKNSQLTDFGGSTLLFNNNQNLTDIYIYSVNVTNISKLLFGERMPNTVKIHIYLTDGGKETNTYKAFKNTGYSVSQPNQNNVILTGI